MGYGLNHTLLCHLKRNKGMNKFKEIPIKATICQLSTDIIDVNPQTKKYQFCSFPLEVDYREGILFNGKVIIDAKSWDMYSDSHRHLLLTNKIIEGLGVDFNSTEGKQLLALFNYLSLQLNRHLLFGQVADLKPIKRGHGMMQFDQSLTLIGLINDKAGDIN